MLIKIQVKELMNQISIMVSALGSSVLALLKFIQHIRNALHSEKFLSQINKKYK